MKKLDKLVLGAFLGPFLITFLVIVFILLNIQMIKYFDDIIGKGLDWFVVGQLFFYFGVITTPTALPLAVLLSSLIGYGNLGEHFELTAIKGAGISMLRTIYPIFFFVCGLTVVAFFANNDMVPKAALEAYSLLYDIKQKKPALDLREGAFYSGIPGVSIKVNKKFPDGETIKDIIIYDHQDNQGNKDVTLADSGRMYTILNEQYLKLELFNGYKYQEGLSKESKMIGEKKRRTETESRSKFDRSQVVFDLSSFKLERTDKKWFQGNRIMRNLKELDIDVDSMHNEILNQRLAYYQNKPSLFIYMDAHDSLKLPAYLKKYRDNRDSIADIKRTLEREKRKKEAKEKDSVEEKNKRKRLDSLRTNRLQEKELKKNKFTPPKRNTSPKEENKKLEPDTLAQSARDTLDFQAYQELVTKKLDSVYLIKDTGPLLREAANKVRQVKSNFENNKSEIDKHNLELIIFRIQWHKIIANAFACMAMLLIGAPLGAIIKKGGLGVPFLVSILFFIVYYILSIQGEKLAKQGTIDVVFGVWLPDIVLFIIGLFFLRQARADARLFDTDSYRVAIERFIRAFRKKRMAKTT